MTSIFGTEPIFYPSEYENYCIFSCSKHILCYELCTGTGSLFNVKLLAQK